MTSSAEWDIWTPAEMLATFERALATFEEPTHWTKGCYARSPGGFGVDPENPAATSYCVFGNIYANMPSNLASAYYGQGVWSEPLYEASCVLFDALQLMPGVHIIVDGNEGEPSYDETITTFNDDPDTTIDDVRELLRQGIGILRAEVGDA